MKLKLALLAVLFLFIHTCISAQTDTTVYSFCETMPAFPGGDTAFPGYLKRTIKYPANERLLQREGTVYVYFVINADGSVSDVQVRKSVPNAPGFDSAAVNAIAKMPNWTPATMAGRKVRCAMTLPVKFSLASAPAPNKPKVETSFPGGELAIQKYIDSVMVYPDSAYEAGVEGTVIIRFIVEPDGSISNVIPSGIFTHPLLRTESIRIVSSMPKWNPALDDDGKAMRSGGVVTLHYTLPTKKEMKAIRKKKRQQTSAK